MTPEQWAEIQERDADWGRISPPDTGVSTGHFQCVNDRRALIAHASSLQAMRTALEGLVRLKDLKGDAEAINTSGSWEAVHKQRAMREEYERAKPLAWDAARAALKERQP